MRLVTKWLLTSIGGCALITAGLLALPDSVVDVTASNPIADKVEEVVFWPMAVCAYLSGPGAPVGPPEKHMYEATPVQIVAAFLGVGVTWFFYSSLGFLIFWLQRRRRAIPRTTPTPGKGTNRESGG